MHIPLPRTFVRHPGAWPAGAARLGASFGLAVALSAAGLGGVTWASSVTLLTKGHRPPAYRTVSVPAASLRLSVPRRWQNYHLTRQTLTQLANQLQGNPTAKAAVADIEGSFGQYVKFLALDSATHQDLVVVRIPLPAGATLPEVQSSVASELKTASANFHASQTTVGGKPAVRIDVSSYHVTVGGRQLPPQSQFYVLEGSNAVGLDINGASKATINAIVRSVHFTD